MKKEINKKSEKNLRIATYPSISRNLLSKLMKEFHSQNPEVTFSIKVLDDLNGVFENDEADIIFADSITMKSYDWTLIATDNYYLIAEKGFAEEGKTFSIEELYSKLTMPYINVQDKNLLPFVDDSKFFEVLTLHSEDDLSVVDMVKAGMGATILPNLVIKGITDDVSVWDIEPKISRNLGFACKQGKRSYALNEFLKFLKQKARVNI